MRVPRAQAPFGQADQDVDHDDDADVDRGDAGPHLERQERVAHQLLAGAVELEDADDADEAGVLHHADEVVAPGGHGDADRLGQGDRA